MKRITYSLVMAIFCITPAFSQLGLEDGAKNIWDEIRGAAVYVFVAIFLVSVLINIGKLFGDNRDYSGFFRGLLLWVGVMLLIGGIISYILSLSF